MHWFLSLSLFPSLLCLSHFFIFVFSFVVFCCCHCERRSYRYRYCMHGYMVFVRNMFGLKPILKYFSYIAATIILTVFLGVTTSSNTFSESNWQLIQLRMKFICPSAHRNDVVYCACLRFVLPACTGVLSVCPVFDEILRVVLVTEHCAPPQCISQTQGKHPVRNGEISYPTCRNRGSNPETQRWKVITVTTELTLKV